ncbi:MAG: paraquat-inducible protein A [Desulfobacteraceae bacterium]
MMVKATAATAYIACPACDLLHLRRPVPAGTTARCTRCATPLYRNRGRSLEWPLCLVLAASILFAISNLFPFLTLKIEGRTEETVLMTGIMALYHQGQLGLAALVLLTGLVCPLLQLVGYVYVLLSLHTGAGSSFAAEAYRWVRHVQPWSMIEILLLGILVSVVKLAGMAEVMPGVALYAFMILIFILPAAMVAIDAVSLWDRFPIAAA